MNELKRVYLAGKVTGLNYKNAVKKFENAKQFLLSEGFDEVVNPMELVPHDAGWTDAMLILLPYLATCNYIAILPGYEDSNGSMTEYYFARGMENEGKLKAIIHINIKNKPMNHTYEKSARFFFIALICLALTVLFILLTQ